jgi:hypothetical protein
MLATTLALEPIAIRARSVHRIENGKGKRISCARGVTWVTQERDPRDIILVAGHSIVLDQRGLAVVFALKDAVITVGAAWQLPAAGGVSVPSVAERALV